MLPMKTIALLAFQVFLLQFCFTPKLWSQGHRGLDPVTERPLAIEQTADLLGIGAALRAVHQSASSDQDGRLAAQQQVIATVTVASLDVDATTGQIDEEIAETHALQN